MPNVDYDEAVKINHSSNWSYIPDHPYRTLIIGALGSGKTNVLPSLRQHQQPDVGKVDWYVKDSLE